MADKITEGTYLFICCHKDWIDEETGKRGERNTYIKVPSPRNNLTKQQIINATTPLFVNGLITSAKQEHYSDTDITTAYTEYQHERDLDIGWVE